MTPQSQNAICLKLSNDGQCLSFVTAQVLAQFNGAKTRSSLNWPVVEEFNAAKVQIMTPFNTTDPAVPKYLTRPELSSFLIKVIQYRKWRSASDDNASVSDATSRHRTRMSVSLIMLSSVVLFGCGEGSFNSIELMPAPVLYTETAFDPFPQNIEGESQAQSKLFYVTDREPADSGDPQPFYKNERGQLARAGVVKVELSPGVQDWDEFVDITLQGKRDRKYLLNVTEATEIGVLPYSVAALFPDAPSEQDMSAAGSAFARAVNSELALSKNKDVHIYIHGYNVDFEYSTLVAREIEHFMGYEGAFIAYNWSATPNRFAYFKDQESATASRRNLRSLIEFLSENTNAERINLIGYSAGSRLTFEVAYQVALLNRSGSGPRLGNVILVSSDLDRSYVGHTLADGVLDAVDRLSIYSSGTDSALRVSSIVFGRDRLGQSFSEEDDVWPELQQAALALPKLEIIDVTDAEESALGNGHSFFRTSPWASSDIFMSLLTPLNAGERGLVRQEGDAVWEFPNDYPARLARIKGRGPIQ